MTVSGNSVCAFAGGSVLLFVVLRFAPSADGGLCVQTIIQHFTTSAVDHLPTSPMHRGAFVQQHRHYSMPGQATALPAWDQLRQVGDTVQCVVPSRHCNASSENADVRAHPLQVQVQLMAGFTMVAPAAFTLVPTAAADDVPQVHHQEHRRPLADVTNAQLRQKHNSAHLFVHFSHL